jgi:integrase
MTLGLHGPLTPETARQKAFGHLAEVQDGGDPSAARQEHLRAPTVAELGTRYLEQHAVPKKKPSSAASDRAMLRRHVIPVLGRMRVVEVTRQDVSLLHHALRETPIIANRVIALLSKMFNLAERWGLRPDGSNPCRHVDRYPERPRERFLSMEEYERLGGALAEAEEQNTEPPSAIGAIRLLALTGARRGEILGLRWDNVDLDRGYLRLDESKTGKRLIVLSTPAQEVLAGLQRKRIDGSPWVCPGRNPAKPLVGLERIWFRIRDAAGLAGVRLHDLRHSYASVGAGSGTSLLMIGKLLGHTQPVTTARYAHLADHPLRAAGEATARRIAVAMAAKPPATVTALRVVSESDAQEDRQAEGTEDAKSALHAG